jgi:predicted enzyme related to lactoylglutathione lyase
VIPTAAFPANISREEACGGNDEAQSGDVLLGGARDERRAAAKKFYTSLFGWSINEFPMGDGATYTMLERNGKQAGALYQLGPEQKGVPSHWNSYVCVASADESAAKAKKLGGTVVMEPFDVMDQGRLANVQDPRVRGRR